LIYFNVFENDQPGYIFGEHILKSCSTLLRTTGVRMRRPQFISEHARNARGILGRLIAFIMAQERAAELQGAVDATRKSVDLALIQYREGAITFERIFNLQNVLVRQQIDQARARAEISLALIDVYRALRGGWQIRLDMPPGASGFTAVNANSCPPVIEELPPLPQ
jgi:hypothetical protein